MKTSNNDKTKMLLLGTVVFLNGCVGMNSKFDCNVSSGGRCAPMGSIHKMVDRGEFNEVSSQKIIEHNYLAKLSSINRNNGSNGNKYQGYLLNSFPYPLNTVSYLLRSRETIQQIWIAPYEDTNGNYHESAHVYAVVKKSQWLAEAEQPVQD